MQIIPMRGLKNTEEVERRCANGPVYVTKNGHVHLIVMDMEYYKQLMQKMSEATMVIEGLEDIKEGRTVDGNTAIGNIRSKYRI